MPESSLPLYIEQMVERLKIIVAEKT